MILFELGLEPRLEQHALAHPSNLGNPELPFGVSFFYGEEDWVRAMDREGGRQVV